MNFMLLSRRESLIVLGASMLRAATPNRSVAFHYTAAFTPDEIRWYRRFSILVTGAILGQRLSDELKREGSKLVAYEWSSAFYPGDSASATPDWQALVLQNRRRWLLNSEPVGGGAADGLRTAFWYDFGNPEFVTARARYLAQRLRVSRYAGYFFDTLGFAHLPGELKKEFLRRHPGTDYEVAQGSLLKEMRALARGNILFFRTRVIATRTLICLTSIWMRRKAHLLISIPRGRRSCGIFGIPALPGNLLVCPWPS